MMMAENETTTAYSSSTPAAATNRAAVIAPGAGVGRRKEAVARVRLVPGTGRWTVNNKTLEVYFPIRFTSNQFLSRFALLAQKASTTLLHALMVAEFLAKPAHFDSELPVHSMQSIRTQTAQLSRRRNSLLVIHALLSARSTA